MGDPIQTHVRNRLLSIMSTADFGLLAPHLNGVKLGRGKVIAEPGSVIEHVYFLDSGVGSLVAISPEGLEAEAGIFGREGLSPAAVLLGAKTTPNRIFIQLPDDAWRIAVAPLLAAMEASASLRGLLLRYVQTTMVQTEFTALSNAVHPVEQRLARWLLMCADRVDGSEMALTHDFLAIMLAVRRPSVTASLHVLEGRSLIRSERGCVIIRNRAALEHFAGDSYGKPEAAYRTLVGEFAWREPPGLRA